MATVNWLDLMNNAGSGSFDPLPNGIYDVEVEKAEAKNSSTGKLMFAVTFKVITGPHANRKLWNNFVVSTDNENAMGFFFRHMAAMGLGKDFFSQQPTPDTIANTLVGKRARLDVGQKVYNQENRNEIKKVLPLAGTPAGPGASTPAPPPPPPPAPAPQPAAPVETPPAPAPEPTPEATPSPEASSPVGEPVSAGAGAPPSVPF